MQLELLTACEIRNGTIKAAVPDTMVYLREPAGRIAYFILPI